MAKRNGALPRCVKDAPAEIAAALERGDGPSAIYIANAALLGSLAAVNKRRTPADALFLHAEAAGEIVALATALHGLSPAPPPEYAGDIPRGRDLRSICQATFSKALGRFSARRAVPDGA